MRYWIFQAKPERYDLRDPDKLVPGETENWVASRYRSRMTPNDVVFFWLSGPPEIRGVYGWGELIGYPFLADDGHRVPVKYKVKFGKFLPASELKKKKQLSNLLILRLAIGTNFEVSQGEAKAVACMLNPGQRPEGL